jgi:type VI secretion system protein ImpG
MENLLPHYEHELMRLRRSAREFAARNPKIAARLALSGEHSEDPHIERMLQSFALLGARIDTRLDDDYPEFSEALLEILYPRYLRALPSCSIAQFDASNLFAQLTEPVIVSRGTELETRTGKCRFRTVFDVKLAPLKIRSAKYSSTISAPTMARLPSDATGLISITFGSATESGTLEAQTAGTTRLHLHGQFPLVGTLTDALLMHAAAAFVEADSRGTWKALSGIPVHEAGFADREALIGDADGSPPGFRLLLDYFAFPDKFNFVDVDLAALARAAGPSRELTLHVVVRNIPADSEAARALEKLTTSTLKLFCTPVTNLFEREAMPIELSDATAAYPVVPQSLQASTAEVYSIDRVYVTEQGASGTTETDIPPYHALRHGTSHRNSDPYWLARRSGPFTMDRSASETLLSLVGIDGSPTLPGSRKIGIDLTCTNRDIPATLPFGSNDGDLLNESASLSCPITMLTRPTRQMRLSRERGSLWWLISRMTPHPFALAPSGLAGLKQTLHQHAGAGFATATRHIDGIVGLDHQVVTRWLPIKPFPTFLRGIEVRLTVDESAFAGSSTALFAGVMDRLFEPYANVNSFVQLVLFSAGR